jgi:hypothetical protein
MVAPLASIAQGWTRLVGTLANIVEAAGKRSKPARACERLAATAGLNRHNKFDGHDSHIEESHRFSVAGVNTNRWEN